MFENFGKYSPEHIEMLLESLLLDYKVSCNQKKNWTLLFLIKSGAM